MKDLKSLQQLINDKAEYRLNLEIGKIQSFVKTHALLSRTDNPGLPDIYYLKDDGSYVGKKPYWFFDVNNCFFLDKVKEYWLPIFIAEETENFLKKVEELETDIQELKNVQYAADH